MVAEASDFTADATAEAVYSQTRQTREMNRYKAIMSERSKAQGVRDERLKAALQENLRRRRAQARSLEQPSRPADDNTDDDQTDA